MIHQFIHPNQLTGFRRQRCWARCSSRMANWAWQIKYFQGNVDSKNFTGVLCEEESIDYASGFGVLVQPFQRSWDFKGDSTLLWSFDNRSFLYLWQGKDTKVLMEFHCHGSVPNDVDGKKFPGYFKNEKKIFNFRRCIS